MGPAATAPSIGIVGAGIGGLALSNALLKRGFTRVKIYDQAEKFLPTVGAGFGFSPNGQICLSSIGIDEHRKILHPFDSITRLDRDGDIKLTSYLFRDLRKKYGFGFAGCLRADLVDILAKPLKDHLHYSHKMVAIAEKDEKVHLAFENGTREEFDLVIGADGIHSIVAEQMEIDPSPPVYSGANIFYGIIPNPDSIDYQHPVLSSFVDNTVMQGPGSGEFISFRVGPDERKLHIWANTYIAHAPPQNTDEWDLAREQTSKELSDVLDQFPKTHPIHELASLTPHDRLLHFGLFYRRHKDSWSNGGRVCLLGDACHATLPYIGQGANQAIEDAIVMAECLDQSRSNYREAFDNFYRRRSRRTRRIVRMAGFLDNLYHSRNPVARAVLEYVLTSVTKGGMVYKQVEKEIMEECPIDYREFMS